MYEEPKIAVLDSGVLEVIDYYGVSVKQLHEVVLDDQLVAATHIDVLVPEKAEVVADQLDSSIDPKFIESTVLNH